VFYIYGSYVLYIYGSYVFVYTYDPYIYEYRIICVVYIRILCVCVYICVVYIVIYGSYVVPRCSRVRYLHEDIYEHIQVVDSVRMCLYIYGSSVLLYMFTYTFVLNLYVFFFEQWIGMYTPEYIRTWMYGTGYVLILF
jgi:hypothetical protein